MPSIHVEAKQTIYELLMKYFWATDDVYGRKITPEQYRNQLSTLFNGEGDFLYISSDGSTTQFDALQGWYDFLMSTLDNFSYCQHLTGNTLIEITQLQRADDGSLTNAAATARCHLHSWHLSNTTANEFIGSYTFGAQYSNKLGWQLRGLTLEVQSIATRQLAEN